MYKRKGTQCVLDVVTLDYSMIITFNSNVLLPYSTLAYIRTAVNSAIRCSCSRSRSALAGPGTGPAGETVQPVVFEVQVDLPEGAFSGPPDCDARVRIHPPAAGSVGPGQWPGLFLVLDCDFQSMYNLVSLIARPSSPPLAATPLAAGRRLRPQRPPPVCP